MPETDQAHTGPMRITVDLARCTGTANCVVAAPAFFDIDDDDEQVTVLRHEVPPDQLAAVENAIRQCPQAALSLEHS